MQRQRKAKNEYAVGLISSVFTPCPGNQGSFPDRVILKTQNIVRYGSMIKYSNPWNGVATSPTLWCCIY